jgi:hypothetical protein
MFVAVNHMRTTYIRRDVNEVRFVLDVHAYLNFYSSSSLQQTSAGKHGCQQQYIMYIHIFDCNEEGTIDDMIFICDLHRVPYYHTYKTVAH